MMRSNRKNAPKIARKIKNTNRIVRVYNNRLNRCFQRVSDDLGCPYQLVFDEFCEWFEDSSDLHMTGLSDLLSDRLLRRYTED